MPASLIIFGYRVMMGSDTCNTKGDSGGYSTQTQDTASLQAPLAEDETRGLFGHAFLDQAPGRL